MKKYSVILLLMLLCLVSCTKTGNAVSESTVSVETKAVANPSTPLEKYSYIMGAMVYDTYYSNYKIDADYLIKGINDWKNGTMSIPEEKFQEVAREFSEWFLNELGAKNLKAAEDFLAENKKKDGVITTESGLEYVVKKMGNGDIPKQDDNVSVYYTLYTLDGTVYDKADESNGPATFNLGNLIPGFREVCTKVPTGSSVTVWIHPSMGYGEYGTSNIEPNTLLIFDIQILSVE